MSPIIPNRKPGIPNSVTPFDEVAEAGRGASKLKKSQTSVVVAGIQGIQDELDEAEAARLRMEADKYHRLVESNLFGSAVGVLIGLNGVMLGIQTDYDFQTMDSGWQAFGKFVEYFFTLCFSGELCLKGYVYRKQFFIGPDRAWNLFDLFLVGLSVLEAFILPFIEVDADMSQMSVLRLVRLVRLARLVRLLRVFKQLWLFVIGLVQALNVMFWGVLLTVLVIYMAAIYVTRSFEQICTEDPFFDAHFGTMIRSMFTLFQISTGDSWASGVVRPVLDHYPNMLLFFVCFLCITQFAFLNVVVAVIVESVLKQAMTNDAEILEAAEAELKNVLRGLYDAFTEMDSDGDLELTREEFLTGMENSSVKVALSKVDISPQDAEEMFDILDHDKSGSLKLEEFIDGCVRGRGHAKAKDILWMMKRLTGFENAMTSRFEQLENTLCPHYASDDGANRSEDTKESGRKLPAIVATADKGPVDALGDRVGAIEETLVSLTKAIDTNFQDFSKKLERLETERNVSATAASTSIDQKFRDLSNQLERLEKGRDASVISSMIANPEAGYQQNATSSKTTLTITQQWSKAEAAPEITPLSKSADKSGNGNNSQQQPDGSVMGGPSDVQVPTSCDNTDIVWQDDDTLC